ncbi:MAG: S24 family peptidase [Pseudomonadota bacterium]|nr:S24 family peptidase [Pseudomonadota bacterium]
MEKNIGDRIRERRRELGLNQPQLGKLVGRTKGAVSQWESGTVKPDRDSLISLARVLRCTHEWLMDGKESESVVTEALGLYHAGSDVAPAPAIAGMAPEISWVQAGAWTEVCHVELDPEAVDWYPRPPGASDRTFVLRVVGESMMPEYTPGRLIFVDPERAAASGDDVVAVMTETGEATFKRFIEEPGSGKMLKALNPAWHEPYVKINGNCRVVGVVVADMRMR